MSTENGMNMSQPGANARLKEISAWVQYDLSKNGLVGGCYTAPDSWKPDTDEEQLEAKFLKKLLLAQTAENIGKACLPSFLIKCLITQKDRDSYTPDVIDNAVEIEEAFRRITNAFNLNNMEADQAKLLADRLNDDTRADKGNDYMDLNCAIFACAEKFNIIKQAVAKTNKAATPADHGKPEAAGELKSKPSTKPAPATPTDALESEIIRILSRDFPNTKALPTASQFYHEYVITGRKMAELSKAKGWKRRTLIMRKADITTHLTRTLKTPVDLDALRTAHRKSGRIVYVDPHKIEQTHGDKTQREEE